MASLKNVWKTSVFECSTLEVSLRILLILKEKVREQINKIKQKLEKITKIEAFPKFIELIENILDQNITESNKCYVELESFIFEDSMSFGSKISENIQPIDMLRVLLAYFHSYDCMIYVKIFNALNCECSKNCILHQNFYMQEFDTLCKKCLDKSERKNIAFSICQYFDTNFILNEGYNEEYEFIAKSPGYVDVQIICRIISQHKERFLESLKMMPEYITGRDCSSCNQPKNKVGISNILDIFIIEFIWKIGVSCLDTFIILSSISRYLDLGKIFGRNLARYELRTIVTKKFGKYEFIDVFDIDQNRLKWLDLIQYLSLNCFYPLNLIYRKIDEPRDDFRILLRDYIKIFKAVLQTNWLSLNLQLKFNQSSDSESVLDPKFKLLSKNLENSIKYRNYNENFIV